MSYRKDKKIEKDYRIRQTIRGNIQEVLITYYVSSEEGNLMPYSCVREKSWRKRL